MAKFTKDDHFASFSKHLQTVILGYGSDDRDFTEKQKNQVETLIKYEKEFKKTLLKDCRGLSVYKAFIKSRNNILTARPFFRERQGSFSTGISPAIRDNNPKALSKFDINYLFINFALRSRSWGPNSKITKAAKKVEIIRREIIETNLPLAISQARVFRHVMPDSHLSYMDMMQIAFEGLIKAVDKFVLPYTPVFRSVILGRAKGDLIENYNDTMLHFYPSDKRKIYRANKIQKGRDREETDYNLLATDVNKTGPQLPAPTNEAEIQNLIMAASHFSLDSHAPDNANSEEGETLSDLYADDPSLRPDFKVETNEVYDKLESSFKALNVLEIKLLRMKGIELC